MIATDYSMFFAVDCKIHILYTHERKDPYITNCFIITWLSEMLSCPLANLLKGGRGGSVI